MLRISTAVTATALVAGATVALAGAPASAATTDTVAPKVVSTAMGLTEVVLPAKGFGRKVNFSVRATDNVGVKGVLVGLFQKGELVKLPTGEDIIFPLKRTAGTAKDGVWSSWIRDEAADGAGSFTLRVIAFDQAENTSELVKVGTYRTRNNTKLSLEVADKTVAADQPVLLAGELRRVGLTGWQAFAGQKLVVQFRAPGATEWKRVGRVYSNALGHFSAQLAPKAGSYRVVFAGDAKDVAAVSVARKVTVG